MTRPKTWYEFHASKFEADTAHLTLEEKGAYLTLLNFHFLHGSIPSDIDRIRIIFGETKQKTRKIFSVLEQFFYEKDGQFYQKRMVEVIAKAIDVSGKRQDAGRKGGLAKAKANGIAKSYTVTKTVTNKDKNTSASGDARQAERFAEWWAEYPNKKDRKKALAKWKARLLDRLADTLIADTKRRKTEDRGWLDGFVPLPTTYINGDRWEDAIDRPNQQTAKSPQDELAGLPNHKLPDFCRRHGLPTEAPRGADYDGWKRQIAERLRTQA